MAFDIHLVRTVHHYFRDGFVGDQIFQRAKAQRFVEHFVLKARRVDACRQLAALAHLFDDLVYLIACLAFETCAVHARHGETLEVEAGDQFLLYLLASLTAHDGLRIGLRPGIRDIRAIKGISGISSISRINGIGRISGINAVIAINAVRAIVASDVPRVIAAAGGGLYRRDAQHAIADLHNGVCA